MIAGQVHFILTEGCHNLLGLEKKLDRSAYMIVFLFTDNNVSFVTLICRLSSEIDSDAQPSTIDWLELVQAVDKVQKQCCKYPKIMIYH